MGQGIDGGLVVRFNAYVADTDGATDSIAGRNITQFDVLVRI